MKELTRRQFIGLATTGLALAGCGKAEKLEERVEEVQTSGFITVDGFKIPYFIEGKGIPCIIIGSTTNWPRKTLSAKLKEYFKFISIDSRLLVPLNKPIDSSDLTIDSQIEDIEKVRNELGLSEICVLGHSIGGIFAFQYARKYPQYTSHAIMIGTPPGWNKKIIEEINEYWEFHASDERKSILRENWEKYPKEKFDNLSPSDKVVMQDILNAPKYHVDPKYDNSWLWKNESWNVEAMNYLFNKLMADYDITSGAQVTTPVFLALGHFDYIVPPQVWRDVKDVFGNLSFNIFEMSGHYPMMEEQELFDKKLIEWISSH